MLICAGKTENYPYATSIGVGLVEVASNLTELVLKNNPKRLIFIGSMGLYDCNDELFKIYEFNDAANVEISYLDDLSYSPILKTNAKLNSSSFICKSSKYAIKFKEKFGFLGENMEAFSVFNVASKFNIQASCILIATNYCNESAHNDYMKNYKKANELLEEYLENKGIL